MNREEIIRMAREAGDYLVDKRGREDFIFDCYGIERFAALVAAAERERVAGYMTRRGFEPTSTNDIVEMLEEMFWFSEERFLKSVRTQVVGDALVAAVKAEREACAQIAFNSATYIEAAKAIRARGK